MTVSASAVLSLPGLRAFRVGRFRLAVLWMVAAIAGAAYIDNGIFAYHKTAGYSDLHVLLVSDRLFWSGASTYVLPRIAPPDIGQHGNFFTGPRSSNYPPTFYLLFAPWGFMPDQIARAAWLLIGQLGLATAIIAVYRWLGRPTLREALLVATLSLAFVPVRASVEEGQLGLVLAGLLTLSFAAWIRRKEAASGLLLAATIALKVTPAFLLLYFIWRRAFRLCTWCLGALAALTAATLWLGWLPKWQAYRALEGLMARGTALPRNQSLTGFALRLFVPQSNGQPIAQPPLTAQALAFALEAVLALGVVWILVRLSSRRDASAWVDFSLLMLALPLVQPFAWDNHWAPSVIAIPVAVRLAGAKVLQGWSTAGLVVAYVLMLISDPLYRFLIGIPGSTLGHRRFELLSASFLLYAAVLAALCLGLGALQIETRRRSSLLASPRARGGDEFVVPTDHSATSLRTGE